MWCEFNHYFLNLLKTNVAEIDGETDENDVWVENENTESSTTNYLFFTQEHITPCVLNTIKYINGATDHKIRFESRFYYVTGKYNTDDVSKIFKQLITDQDTHLMLFSNVDHNFTPLPSSPAVVWEELIYTKNC
jgi:hypothetical protein